MLLLACGLFPARVATAAQSHWSVELLVGEAYNARSTTRIEQGALGRLSTSGDYETRGLEAPFHYAWRISRWQGNSAWELQLLHHKLYLKNPPDGVDSLSVSHGFNIVSFNRAWESGGWRFRAGVGPVVTHAEANIAGTAYDGPYELAGAAVLVGVGHRLDLGPHFYLLGEVSASLGWIDAHPRGDPDLEIGIRNPALHAELGAGYRF
ncbi:hypothetical protein GCM10011487_48780 [Steroidobacter agaridevorans]|uniref:Outer membrane protein beta-barrel domain-containing protein n=1 Tax=Steroidobacter agaridevorans TaxID=2695856 RepID=A0A829YJ48_9GAMM|nr:hypothetical protein GCM10011487_48780 [Steroidobacter agaridevorans]GFE85968.1 hypothetical protein GCM10011488_09220 [Steroidobacter agaridevorans]